MSNATAISSCPTDLSILLSTWDQQAWVGRVTLRQLERRWPGHPPVHTCGCSSGVTDLPGMLPLRSHPQDWMSILLDACRDQLDQGFAKLYLILDDHPPVLDCHAFHLNETLPRYLDELGATCIGLNGYGQGRPDGGGRIRDDLHGVEEVDPSFAWKFSLHPGLWNIERLAGILETAVKELAPEQRTAWKFERLGDSGVGLVSDARHRGCYRVCGERMAASPLFSPPALRALRLARARYAVVNRLAGPWMPSAKRENWQARFRYLFRFYEGPYPLFWSGLLQRGRVHEDCLRFLHLVGETQLAEDLQDSLPTVRA
jgi:hypothetical protein